MDNASRKSVYDFDISLQPDYSLLSVQLEEDNQNIYAEPSAMAADSHIHLKAGPKGDAQVVAERVVKA